MSIITLPDGSQRHYDEPVTLQQVAADLGPGLLSAAIAGKINDQTVDLSCLIEADATVALLTNRDQESLEIVRHSSAHLLAQAVKQLFPSAQVTIGPVVDNGFYYDFAHETPFTEDDFLAIEKRMNELVKADLAVSREVMTRHEAIALFESMGEAYKVALIQAIPEEEVLSLYRQGEFIDLCRGPHVPSTGKLKAFKLTKLAGAYWRGDPSNPMLQRIYGTAWLTKQDLKDYLHRLEEAKKRDHRRLAKAMQLFHLQEEAPGMVFWHPNGWQLYRIIKDYMQGIWSAHGYQEIHTPMMMDRGLWERSGHWDQFGDAMFGTSSEHREYAVKPMNCPCHVQVFNQGLKSYRDLPLRLAEFGACYRNEPSGTLHGLMRVRGFVQDDAHIFCTEEMIQEEVAAFMQLLFHVYDDFGFTDRLIKLSTRPETRVGSEAVWDKAELALEQALNQAGLDWELLPGEGAFYGPKIEFSLRDCLGRVWQCGTIQVDFSMPERLGARYVAQDGSRQTPVMLHRAILGSIERFIGVLIEHYAGHLPIWLAPVQAMAMSITDRQADYVKKIVDRLNKQGFRVKSDLRNEKIGFKIREHTLSYIPYLLVIGDREQEDSFVAVRTQKGENLGSMPLEAFAELLKGNTN